MAKFIPPVNWQLPASLFKMLSGESYYDALYLDSCNQSPHLEWRLNEFQQTRVNRRIFCFKKGKVWESFFAWPFIFYRQRLCKIIFANLKNLLSLICGFRFPVSGFRIPDCGLRIPDSGFLFRFRNPESGIRNRDSGFPFPDSRFWIPVSGFQILITGFRFPGFRVAPYLD